MFFELVMETKKEILEVENQKKDATLSATAAAVQLRRAVTLHHTKTVTDEDLERAQSSYSVAQGEAKIAGEQVVERQLSYQIAVKQHAHQVGEPSGSEEIKNLYAARWEVRKKMAVLFQEKTQNEVDFFNKMLARSKSLNQQGVETTEEFQRLKKQRYLALHQLKLAKQKVELLNEVCGNYR